MQIDLRPFFGDLERRLKIAAKPEQLQGEPGSPSPLQSANLPHARGTPSWSVLGTTAWPVPPTSGRAAFACWCLKAAPGLAVPAPSRNPSPACACHPAPTLQASSTLKL